MHGRVGAFKCASDMKVTELHKASKSAFLALELGSFGYGLSTKSESWNSKIWT